MRLIPINEPFWSCQNSNDTNYFVPFGLVDSTDPTDNILSIMWYEPTFISGTGVSSIDIVDMDGNTAANINTTQILSSFVTYNGASKTVRLLRVPVDTIAPFVTCFYVRVNLLSGGQFKTEAFKIFQFDELTPSLIRIESSYKNYDFLHHSIDKNYNLPVENLPNYYGDFAGVTFKNINWFYGSITEGEIKFTKTIEGFFNRNTRTQFNEMYNLYLKPLPPFHAKELSNVLGGTSLSVWNNNRCIDYSLDVTDLTLTPDNKICMVMPTPVKLQVVNSTLYIGCE